MRKRPRIPKSKLRILIENIRGQQMTVIMKHYIRKYSFQMGSGINLIKNINDIDGKRNYYSLYSGGKDSGAVTQWADEAGILKGVKFIDTTIGVNETKEFVKKTCKERGWDLEILTPPKGWEEFVKKFGFSKASDHNIVMRWLKWRPIQVYVRDNKKEKACFLSGVRVDESERRFGNVTTLYRTGRIWIASPIWNWSTFKALTYADSRNIDISPAYNKINMSGDCLCGAYGDEFVRDMIRLFYPDISNKIEKLEKDIVNYDTLKDDRKHWGNKRIKKFHKQLRDKKFSDKEMATCNDCSTSAIRNYALGKGDEDDDIRERWFEYEKRIKLIQKPITSRRII